MNVTFKKAKTENFAVLVDGNATKYSIQSDLINDKKCYGVYNKETAAFFDTGSLTRAKSIVSFWILNKG